MTNDKAKIIERLKKILALANNNDSEGEIENALKFAKELMDTYHISEADIKNADNVIAFCKEFIKSGSSKLTNFEIFLSMAVCDIIGTVKTYYSKKIAITDPITGAYVMENGKVQYKHGIYFYGENTDVVFAGIVYETLLRRITNIALNRYGTIWRGDGRSYADGFVQGLLTKLNEAKNKNDNAIKAIILSKTQAAENWLKKEEGLTLTKSKAKISVHDENAYSKGNVDGRNTDTNFNRPLNSGNGSSVKMLS